MRIWLLLLGYVLLALLIPLSFHMFWQTRFLIPVIPLAIITAAFGVTKLGGFFGKRWCKLSIVTFCLIYGIILTGIIIETNRDFFGEIRRSAEYIKENIRPIPVYSDEVTKTSFWSMDKIHRYRREEIEPGQYVVLHSFYTDLEEEIKFLQDRFNIIEIDREKRVLYASKLSAIPLFSLEGIAPKCGECQRLFQTKKPKHESIILFIKSIK